MFQWRGVPMDHRRHIDRNKSLYNGYGDLPEGG